MPIFANAEGAANAVDVTNTTLTAGGDSASSTIAKNTGATIQHSTVRTIKGARTFQFYWAPATAGYIRWTWTSAVRSVAQVWIYREDGNTAGYIELLGFRNSGGYVARLAMTNGVLNLTSAATTVTVPTYTLPTGAWYRMELAVTKGTTTSNGRIEAAVFDPDSTTPLWSVDTGNTANTGTTDFALFQLGTSGPPTVATTVYFDALRVDEKAAGWFGPSTVDLFPAGTGVPVYAAGKFGNSYDPNSGRLTHITPFSGSTNTWTIEAWVNHTGAAATRMAVTVGTTAATSVRLGVNSDGKPYLAIGTFVYNYDANALGTGWHHLAISVAAGNARLFVDGVLRNTTGGMGSVPNNWASMTVGQSATGTQQWVGQIDEVRVSNVARYTAAFTPATVPFTSDANTLALYHFEADGTSGDTTLSASGQIKVWNGTAFVAKPVKHWNGTAFVTKPVKRWNGTTWQITPY